MLITDIATASGCGRPRAEALSIGLALAGFAALILLGAVEPMILLLLLVVGLVAFAANSVKNAARNARNRLIRDIHPSSGSC